MVGMKAITRPGDLYCLVFLPALTKKPMDFVITKLNNGAKIYKQNEGLFKKLGGYNATKEDFYKYVEEKLLKGIKGGNIPATTKTQVPTPTKENPRNFIASTDSKPAQSSNIDVDNTEEDISGKKYAI
jgi:hypothetical protein